MTAHEKAAVIIAETLEKVHGTPKDTARSILRALAKKRIAPVTMVASVDMLRRFHSHCRWLGRQTGYGYRHHYNEAIEYAESMDEWPVKVIQRMVDIGGETITIDVSVPESTTRATNKQLMTAYEVIEDTAKELGISLPENVEEPID